MEGMEHEEENLGIGNTIRPARLKIGGKGKKSGERNKMSRKGEKDQKKIVGMEKKDEEKKEKTKRDWRKKGRYRTREGEIGRRYHTNRNVRGIINRLGSIGNPEKASLGAI